MKNIILIYMLLNVFCVYTQKHTIQESTNITTTLTLFIGDDQETKTRYESNMGFIRNTTSRKNHRQFIDTIYFNKNLNETPESRLESKLSRIKINNSYQHYLVYDTDPWESYTLKKRRCTSGRIF